MNYNMWNCQTANWTNSMHTVQVRGKAVTLQPWQALRVPEGWGSQISRQSAHKGGNVVSYVLAAFTPRKYSWYLFLLEAESSPWPQCGQKDCVNEKLNYTKTFEVGRENKGMLLYVFQQKLNYTNLFTRFTKKSNSFHTE